MKADFTRFFDQILRPFIGTGIGNYFPFKECITLYARFSKGTHRFTIKKTAYDFMLELESGKLVDEMIIKNGIWEKGVSDTISKYLKKGDTFVDIGANI